MVKQTALAIILSLGLIAPAAAQTTASGQAAGSKRPLQRVTQMLRLRAGHLAREKLTPQDRQQIRQGLQMLRRDLRAIRKGKTR